MGLGVAIEMAEREGFEPSVEVSPHTRLAGENIGLQRVNIVRKYLILLSLAICPNQ
jgi:hypothetical protein